MQDMHDMLVKSYHYVGGYAGLGSGSKEESKAIHSDLSNPDHIIKVIKRGSAITALAMYKPQFGRKGIASATRSVLEAALIDAINIIASIVANEIVSLQAQLISSSTRSNTIADSNFKKRNEYLKIKLNNDCPCVPSFIAILMFLI